MTDFSNIYIYNDMMSLITGYLSPRDLASLRLVCQTLKNKVSAATVLQPLYNRLYQMDKTLPAHIDSTNAFLSFTQAFEKIRARQEEEIAYFRGPKLNFPNIRANSIEALQQRDAILNRININKINQAISEQPGFELNLSGSFLQKAGLTRFIVPEDKQEYFANLQKLECRYGLLTTLSFEGCVALKKLDCTSNKLTFLNLKDCAALQILEVDNNNLTTLNLQGKSALINLKCSNNQLSTLNVEGCAALKILYCNKNKLTTLNVNKCTALEILQCHDNQLIALSADGCTALLSLACDYNKLTTLNLKDCAVLQPLYGIEVDKLIALVELNLQGVSAGVQQELGDIEEKLLVEQLIYAGSSERENIIQRLGERYNTENCLKYSCIHAASLSSADEPWEDLKSFLPMMQAIREDFMDEDRVRNPKREREDIEKNEGPESKKRKPNGS